VETFERLAQNKCIIEECASRWLAEIDSDIGKLDYVSKLLDVSSGRYSHPALEDIYSSPAVHQALLYCHEELFEKALGDSLELLEWDLRTYFAGIDGSADEIAARWLEIEYFRLFMPLGVPSNLFLSNMTVVLKLIAARRASQEAAARISPLLPRYRPASLGLL
jgi:hypothetical protein